MEALHALIQKQAMEKVVLSILSGHLQQVVSSSKAQQQEEAYLRSQSVELIPEIRHLQNGNSRNHKALLSAVGSGSLIMEMSKVPSSVRTGISKT